MVEDISIKLIVDFILVLGILLNVLAIFGLFSIKDRRLPHYILIVFWCFILGILLYFYGNWHDLSWLVFVANYVEDGARLIIPPLIYLYTKSILFSNDGSFLRKHLPHFITFVVYLLIYTIPKSINPDLHYLKIIDQYIDWALVQDTFGLVYFLVTLSIFYRFKDSLKHNYATIVKKNFLWLEHFLISFTAVLFIDLLITISEVAFAYNVQWDGYITVFFLIVAMSYLWYYGQQQPMVFLPVELPSLKPPNQRKTKAKEGIYLDESEQVGLKKQYYKCMEVDRLFLLPDLQLSKLAEAMDTTPRKLTALLNEVLDTNFHDAINAYRVEEAKQRLQSNIPEQYSITGIGLSCGFSSKSSFYRIFKKHTSLSPSAYRKMYLDQSHS
ncbi:MAG: helix-turn-helix domain-containing protein [Bacteroidota bacterium]